MNRLELVVCFTIFRIIIQSIHGLFITNVWFNNDWQEYEQRNTTSWMEPQLVRNAFAISLHPI